MTMKLMILLNSSTKVGLNLTLLNFLTQHIDSLVESRDKTSEAN